VPLRLERAAPLQEVLNAELNEIYILAVHALVRTLATAWAEQCD
jgi:hypothetical protein